MKIISYIGTRITIPKIEDQHVTYSHTDPLKKAVIVYIMFHPKHAVIGKKHSAL